MSTQIADKIKADDLINEPPMYKVILLNDNYTTMDFVVHILETVFRKSLSEAVTIMYQVHEEGSGVCGTYTSEIAETKVNIVHEQAEKAGYPLKAIMQPA